MLATGVGPERYDGEASSAPWPTPASRPSSILVVTDRLDFAALLRAGAGFEHVPAEGERQPELAGGAVRGVSARRLGADPRSPAAPSAAWSSSS